MDWSKLRTWKDDRRFGFEELCCQLAACEDMPEGSKWTRNGTPDGGVEGFWTLPDGSQHAWQAKFFRDRPGNVQWTQVEKSIKTALKKYPQLKKYYVCMPTDRANPQKDKQTWFMDDWNEHVEEWKKRANKKGMAVEFEYWGEHEIATRFSLDKHRGRHYFWFHEESFTIGWFKKNLQKSIKSVDARYSPKLNIELPILKIFESFSQSEKFINSIKKHISSLISKRNEVNKKWVFEKYKIRKAILLDYSQKLIYQLNSIVLDGDIKYESLKEFIDRVSKYSDKLYWNYRRKVKKKYETDISEYWIKQLNDVFYDLYSFVYSSEFEAYFNQKLMLISQAGFGKTHLYCDIANRKIKKDIPVILLLGQTFTDGPLWPQIMALLGLSISMPPAEFLGALDACADLYREKLLIFIDALNETEVESLWYNNLIRFLEDISEYENIRVSFSVRTPFLPLIIPQSVNEEINIVEHTGFGSKVFDAVIKYFSHYDIELPDSPLLHPEFNNPLFLKIFCESYKKSNLKRISQKAISLTGIFDFFMQSIEDDLSKRHSQSFDCELSPVRKSLYAIARYMAKNNTEHIVYDKANDLISQFWPKNFNPIQILISEGVLIKDVLGVRKGSSIVYLKIIRFVYQRFSDHIIASYLIAQKSSQVSKGDTYFKRVFKYISLIRFKWIFNKGRLAYIAKDENACYRHAGLIQAFSIQLPEMYGIELFQLLPKKQINHIIIEAFIESIRWRSTSSINHNVKKHIEGFLEKKEFQDYVFHVLSDIAVYPEHPVNINYLHEILIEKTLPQRDVSWSSFIYKHYYEKSFCIVGFIQWCLDEGKNKYIHRNSKLLYATLLCWYFTTSNRFLRDRATKSLVSLLKNEIDLLLPLLDKFKDVNDPYVLERLYAVAYGCSMRSTDKQNIKKLAMYVYDAIFKDGNPPADISLREYARGIIEQAKYYFNDINISDKELLPPFKSIWPENLPTLDETERNLLATCENEEYIRSTRAIIGSVRNLDFAIYVISSAITHFWSSRRLGMTRPKTNAEIHEDFVSSLDSFQKTKMEEYEDAIRQGWRISSNFLNNERALQITEEQADSAKNNREIKKNKFRDCLNTQQQVLFESKINEFLLDSRLLHEKDYFDLQLAKAFILHRIKNYGWDGDLLGEFDTKYSREYSGRSPYKKERLGKKYQWMAFKELLARISDNFEYSANSGKTRIYEGGWNVPDIRDIDPSFLLTHIPQQQWESSKQTWWMPYAIQDFRAVPNNDAWLENKTDLPNLKDLISRDDYVNLECFIPIDEEVPYLEDPEKYPRRKIWFMLKSYIVKKNRADEIFKWASKQNYWGRWMPESHDWYGAYYGEYYWSKAYKSIKECGNWETIERGGFEVKLAVSTEEYFCEKGTFDCSLDDGMSILMPCELIATGLGLEHRISEGKYYKNGKLVAFDPSVDETGRSGLLFSLSEMTKFLDDSNYCLLWTLSGQKEIIVTNMSSGGLMGSSIINAAAILKDGQIHCSEPSLSIENLPNPFVPENE